MGQISISPALPHATGAGTTGAKRTAPRATGSEVVTNSEGVRAMERVAAEERTLPVLMAEVRYGIVFGQMNEVFYGRVHRWLLFIGILCGIAAAGSGAFAALKVAHPEFNLVLAIVLGVSAGLVEAARRAFKFDQVESKFRDAWRAFQDLEGKGWRMKQAELETQIANLRKKAPSGGSWLAALAYNKACRELGHPEVQIEVPVATRMAAALAT